MKTVLSIVIHAIFYSAFWYIGFNIGKTRVRISILNFITKNVLPKSSKIIANIKSVDLSDEEKEKSEFELGRAQGRIEATEEIVDSFI